MARRKSKELTVGVAGILPLRSFEGYRIGEPALHPYNDRLDALVSGGFVEVIVDAEAARGQRSAHSGDPEGEPESSPAEGAAGAEPGQGFGSGGYGAAEG